MSYTKYKFENPTSIFKCAGHLLLKRSSVIFVIFDATLAPLHCGRAAACCETKLKYDNFEANFWDQNNFGTSMLIGQNLDIVHIYTPYSFLSRATNRLAVQLDFGSRCSAYVTFFPVVLYGIQTNSK